MRSSILKIRGKAFLPLDQLFSSASNGVLPFLVARQSSPDEFGFFVVGYASFALMLAVVRQFLGIPIALSASAREVRAETSAALFVTAAAFPVVVLVVVGVPWFAGSPPSLLLVALGLSSWLALVQDVLRYSASVDRNYGRLVTSDAVWLAIAVLGFFVPLETKSAPTIVVLLWGLGALLACLTLITRVEFEGLRNGLSLLRASKDSRVDLTVMAVAASASVVATSTIVARLAGPSVSGALGGANQLFAPINLSLALLPLALLPVSVNRSTSWGLRVFAFAGLTLSFGSLVWASVLWSIPSEWGKALLGDTWDSARQILPVVGLVNACVALGAAASTYAIRLGLQRPLARLRVAQGALRVLVAWGVASSVGTALGLAVAEVVVVGLFAAASIFLIGLHMKVARNADCDC